MTKLERRFTALTIGASVVFTAWVVAWRLGWVLGFWPVDWPPVPRMQGFEAFGLYAWLPLLVWAVVGAAGVGWVVRWVTGWRGATGWFAIAVPVLVCVEAAAVYAPFYWWTAQRVDRVAEMVEEPVIVVRRVAVSVVVTLGLAALFLCITRLRRTPAIVRQSAFTVTATLIGILLHLWWVQAFVPMTNDWIPADWRRPDLLVPARPCRGAMLWIPHEWGMPAGRIDDVWLRFADPRRGGEQVWAVSVSGQSWGHYFWLDRAEAERLQVRRDDPAVVRCDERPRTEVVAPAAWHRLGSD
ncbi:MAG TPA: hypothetical protein VEK57_01075 [Thermoanaerobaculia bacterium]|nr:hypothetical protein [Thermoanaerobaculia bacterium]